ncbi:uncharacterized protein LOC129968698 isoform X2 [Argiope bruennichi]|uniref:uncharacterized protein LOC129968698 isoform X2 n=1 Tax=Argiope bruennichi TaxID=94029 RepID=UPI0024947091|nr:uncharacterized protein LOC129968698 isoform X2 [Argiope bruennichi]
MGYHFQKMSSMNPTEMTSLALNKNVLKVSRRDLPYLISQCLSGGTTVAATMALAYRSGISVFATGGIGGVHRGGETSMDVSADLCELSRTPIAVVSAGVKSILDIGRTLEYLETLGVCVAAFGASKDFPAFFTPKSNFKAPCNVESYEEAARLIDSRNQLQLESGILIAVPIPEEYHEQGLQTESVIEEALNEARERNILGRDVTPFVLKRIQELSGGAALEANIGLLQNNARVGAQIAVALNHLNSSRSGPISSRTLRSPVKQEARNVFSSPSGRPVVIGGSILDIHVKTLEDVKMDGRTLAGKVESTAGGVGRNVADCLARLQLNPFFVSSVGAQEHAQALLSKMNHMDTSGIKIVADARTATCIVLLDHCGECLFVIGDMDIHDSLVPEQVEAHRSIMSAAPLVVIDGNIPLKSLDRIFHLCSENRIPVWFEPTDLSRAMRPFQASAKWRSALAYASPNINELRVMHNAVFGTDFQLSEVLGDDLEGILNECLTLGIPLLDHSLHTLVVTLGPYGALLITKLCSESLFPIGQESIPKGKPRAIYYPTPKPEKIVSVSGAGDCFAAGMIGSILKGLQQEECIRSGQKAALLSLASHFAVPNSISPKAVFTSENLEPLNPISVVA